MTVITKFTLLFLMKDGNYTEIGAHATAASIDYINDEYSGVTISTYEYFPEPLSMVNLPQTIASF